MFEIAPFSSFNEFIDLQDFVSVHNRLHKYKTAAKAGGLDLAELMNMDLLTI